MTSLLLALTLAVLPPGANSVTSNQTLSNMTLYVNGGAAGSDYNLCSATKPCKTITAALNKIPHKILHAVVVNIAAGSYAESLVLDYETAQSGSLTLQSTDSWTISTVAGPKYGTATIVPDGGMFDWVVNSVNLSDGGVSGDAGTGNTWATNALVGEFLLVNSETPAPIVANGALTFKAAGAEWAPAAAFVIATPPVTITGNGAGASIIHVVGGQTVKRGLTIADMVLDNTANMAQNVIWLSGGTVTLQYVSIKGNGGGAIYPNEVPVNLTVKSSFIDIPSSTTGIWTNLIQDSIVSSGNVYYCETQSLTGGINEYSYQSVVSSKDSFIGCQYGVVETYSYNDFYFTSDYFHNNVNSITSSMFSVSAYNRVTPTCTGSYSVFDSDTYDIYFTQSGSAIVPGGADAGVANSLSHSDTYVGACATGVMITDPLTGNKIVPQ